MEVLSVRNLEFQYATGEFLLQNLSFEVNQGEMVLLCGPCGCGKTSLLRLLKEELRPAGTMSGTISSIYDSDQIGYLFQHPDHQIVCQTVEEELVFGAENLGMNPMEISRGLAEITAYLGLERMMQAKTSELSGGLKQLVNLASILLMKPKVLLLDEPVSQLDPVSTYEFATLLKKIQQDLNLTIIVVEHDLDQFLKEADRVLFLDQGQITFQGDSMQFVSYILQSGHPYGYSLPETVKLYLEQYQSAQCQSAQCNPERNERYPLSVNELVHVLEDNQACKKQFNQRQGLHEYGHEHEQKQEGDARETSMNTGNPGQEVLTMSKGFFRYQKNMPDILSNLNLSVNAHKKIALIGANGAGKSTLFSVLSGYRKLYQGKMKSKSTVGVLPQNPAYAFFKDNLYEDLKMIATEEQIEAVLTQYEFCQGIRSFLQQNPLDLSGGQMQKAAIVKMLLTGAEILLMDEPVKSMDGYEKHLFAELLDELVASGKTVFFISHDLELIEKTADECLFLFQGRVIADTTPSRMFEDNRFYTTVRGRLRGLGYEV